jgi:hypothetical protein
MQYPQYREELPHGYTGMAVYPDGTICWYNDGMLDTFNTWTVTKPCGAKLYFVRGKCHRENGPAIENLNGKNFWVINGKSCKEEDFQVKLAEYHDQKRNLELAKDKPGH